MQHPFTGKNFHLKRVRIIYKFAWKRGEGRGGAQWGQILFFMQGPWISQKAHLFANLATLLSPCERRKNTHTPIYGVKEFVYIISNLYCSYSTQWSWNIGTNSLVTKTWHSNSFIWKIRLTLNGFTLLKLYFYTSHKFLKHRLELIESGK